MKTDNPIKLGIDAALSSQQFLRKSSTWYREMKETILVVDVQKSNFSEQFYINLGVLVKGLPVNRKEKIPPKENDCHIRLRVEKLKPEKERQLGQALNLEDESIEPVKRQQQIEEIIRSAALPFLLQCSTRDGIRDALHEGQLDGVLVHKSIRDPGFS